MHTPSYFSIRSATVKLLESQGFTLQEALHLIDAEAGYLTYKDKSIVNKLSLDRNENDREKIISFYQKQKLIEYLLGVKSGNSITSD
ncbi:hypothetical protein [Vibrio sp. AND4]|uniref:hypothetical protein n=1 Tax=Vibrio sp. AND4 TaxID=314289 RepID=UPI00015F3561|nr:hypothetical protein [Vibrio sp. AND4]EDP59747.1 hypothetical protein AND4_11334 [Vibrio sp. AND4]